MTLKRSGENLEVGLQSGSSRLRDVVFWSVSDDKVNSLVPLVWPEVKRHARLLKIPSDADLKTFHLCEILDPFISFFSRCDCFAQVHCVFFFKSQKILPFSIF